jgi:hypothetical protein
MRQCYYRYRGEHCDELLLAPIISSPSSTFDLAEGESFSYQLEVSQGSAPIDWAIVSVPISGLTVDTSTGLLLWENPGASSSFIYVRVQATNKLTRLVTAQLAFHVLPSYRALISTDQVSYTRPSPAVYFDFLTVDAVGSPVGGKLAVLWVNEQDRSPGQRRKVTVKTDAFGCFPGLYQQYSHDAGE